MHRTDEDTQKYTVHLLQLEIKRDVGNVTSDLIIWGIQDTDLNTGALNGGGHVIHSPGKDQHNTLIAKIHKSTNFTSSRSTSGTGKSSEYTEKKTRGSARKKPIHEKFPARNQLREENNTVEHQTLMPDETESEGNSIIENYPDEAIDAEEGIGERNDDKEDDISYNDEIVVKEDGQNFPWKPAEKDTDDDEHQPPGEEEEGEQESYGLGQEAWLALQDKAAEEEQDLNTFWKVEGDYDKIRYAQAIVEFGRLRLKPTYNAGFQLVIVKALRAKPHLHVHEEMVIARCQIWAIGRVIQYFPVELLQFGRSTTCWKVMASYMDVNVDPCQDFYQYACGNWWKKNPIPKDKAAYDTFEMLRENLDAVLKELLEEPPSTKNRDFATEVLQKDAVMKAKHLYQSCMNYDILEQRSEQPLLNLLDELGGWPILRPDWDSSQFDWILLMAQLRLYNNDILISEWVGPDIKNSDEYVIQFDQTNLGLPTRDYFLQPSNMVYLDAYKNYLIKIATLLGAPLENATQQAEEIITFEKRLAKNLITSEGKTVDILDTHLQDNNAGTSGGDINNDVDHGDGSDDGNSVGVPTIANVVLALETEEASFCYRTPDERRNVSELYQRMSVGELRQLIPQVDWYRYLTLVLARPVNVSEPVVVFALQYIQDLVTLLGKTQPRVFENKVLRKIFGAKRDEVTGEWRKLHNTELHALYSSPDIIRNIKSRRLRWAGHVARMGESRNAYRVLVGRPEGKRPLGRPRRRWEDNIKMDLREVGYDDRDWINLAQDRDRWRAYVRAAMNLRNSKHSDMFYFRTTANYLLWRFVRHRVNNLDDRFQDAKQRFYYILFGREQAPPRWKYCVSEVNSHLGMALGALFVRKYFHENSKNDSKQASLVYRSSTRVSASEGLSSSAVDRSWRDLSSSAVDRSWRDPEFEYSELSLKTVQMTEDIMLSFRELLSQTNWIDRETKELASQKVDAIVLRIGYPDFILSPQLLNERYADLVIRPDQFFENTLNILRHATRIEQDRLGTHVNKTLWNTPPAIVNAYYSRYKNQIMFPAGILQPPFYHRYFPRSLNYGGIGVVIGHEITHGFDDKGRLFDKDGNLHRWWRDEAIEGFHRRAQCLIDQYSHYTVQEVSMPLDGSITQGENIADNGGIKQAFRAYQRWLHENGDSSETLPGLNATGHQLFFLNFAQIWCGSIRPEAMRNKLKTAVHAPGKFRVIGTLSNSEDFATVFKCPLGSPMNPVNKCSVW
ncbi:hypothetical protein ANN_08317 [Periplaneta americana]|uniref:Uncharacterized protein n=1 Tax=Periplaneta americana TaxID=6978 RepID=A0ABQ8T291_PERAM|nr:hypothetical protein ANN_08317 [Periplaneta americana]